MTLDFVSIQRRSLTVLLVAGSIFSFASVVLVDYFAGSDRRASVRQENERDLTMMWGLAARALELGGVDEFEVDVSPWETLDVYVTDSAGVFLTAPRFWGESAVTAGRRSRAAAVSNALAGEQGFIEAPDYRGAMNLTAYGLVATPGAEVVLIVEMASAEVDATVSKFWYFADELATGGKLLFVFLLLAAGWAVRGRIDGSFSAEEKQAQKDSQELSRQIEAMRSISGESGAATKAYRLRKVLDRLAVGVVVIYRDGSIWMANKRIAQQFGYTVAQMERMSVHDLVSREVRGKHPEIVDSFLSEDDAGEVTHRRVVGIHSDGSEVHLFLGVSSMKDGETVLGVGTTRERETGE